MTCERSDVVVTIILDVCERALGFYFFPLDVLAVVFREQYFFFRCCFVVA